MPIYEYSCKKCGDFEITQRMTEEPLKKCPTCGARVTKLISHSAFHLKGSGWYMTDYAKNGSGKNSGSNDNKSSDGKSSSDTKEASSSSASSDTTASLSTKESSTSTKEKSSSTKESSASA